MSKNASQIVATLLEYGADPDMPRPGGPDDPWRKGNYKSMKFKKSDFAGKRPGETEEPEDDDKAEAEPPALSKPDRFKWKPAEDDKP